MTSGLVTAPRDLLFKVLDTDGRPVNGGKGTWPLPRNGKPGKWLKVEGPLVPCHSMS